MLQNANDFSGICWDRVKREHSGEGVLPGLVSLNFDKDNIISVGEYFAER